MKNIKYLAGLFVVLSTLLISSCSEDLVTGDSTGFVKSVVITGEDIEYEDGMFTRATYTDKLQYSWSMGDTIGIYPLGGDQIAFPISSGDGSKSAEFDGGAWRMRSSFWYAAYYPYSTLNCLVKETSLPVCYLDQIQDGNDSRNGLSKYDYQVSAATKPTSSGGVNIQMKHLGGFMRFALTIPEATELKALVVNSGSTPFVTKGVVDLSQEVPAITPTETSDKLVMLLKNITTSSANESVVLWMTASPMVFAANSMLTVTIYGSDGVRYSAQVLAKDMTPGSGKGYSATLEKVTTGASSEDIDVDFDDEEEVGDTPYVTFHAEVAQTLKMSKAVPTLQYSVDGGTWADLGTTEVAFGGTNGDLRLRGNSSIGTATSPNEGEYSQIIFTNNTPVSASGDIRTLVNWQSYANADCSNARFCMLFRDNKVLISAPDLPSTDLADMCYACMFMGCSTLTKAPDLPAPSLIASCYASMFQMCTALIDAPALNATSLADYCYASMFYGCSSLVDAPALPATSLTKGCYYAMFQNCTSLVVAPELPASTLAEECYYMMFYSDNSLSNIKMLATNVAANKCLYGWPFVGLASTGTFYKNVDASWNDDDVVPEGWTVKYVDAQGNEIPPYVTFHAEAFQSLTMSGDVSTLQYSVGGGEWASLGTTTVTFGGTNGDLRLRGKNEDGTEGRTISFENSTPVSCSGDIRTLIDYSSYETVRTGYAKFNRLFSDCSQLTTAPDLPSSILADNCYKFMFMNCSSLTKAPALPATNLKVGCYSGMFYGCTSLVEAPELPATTIRDESYMSMFSGCTSLVNMPVINALFLRTSSCQSMFEGCTALKSAANFRSTSLMDTEYRFGCASMFKNCTSLEVPPTLSSTIVPPYCYNEMFYGCTSLKTAPVLPARTLTSNCYSKMFYGCTSLSHVEAWFTTTPAYEYTYNWLYNVSSTGTFVKNSNATWDVSGASGIPENWTVETATN